VQIDGSLKDPAWQNAVFTAQFTQREPLDGAAPTERTEVGILFDQKNIYFGIRCFDSEADKIIAREMRRDASVDNDDYFEIILGTYRDNRSGYYFITNPKASKRDAVFASEGRDYNPAWDGVWTCKSHKDENGWYLEISIPLKTLRFAEQDSAIWSINFGRMIRRKNERLFWQPIPRDFGRAGMFRLSEAGTLKGLADLKMGGNLEIKPYFLGGLESDENTSFKTETLTDVGLDAKVALAANLALDLTVNTDFAQVEADRERVNLTRFSLYYPEKREFFLEGAEIFSFAGSGRREGGGSSMHLFYSRRLGLVEGHEARILGGAKMVGKIGSFHLGVLNIITDRITFIEEGDEDTDTDTTQVNESVFSVFRLRRDILKRGTIGLMFLNKEDLHTTQYNRSMGFDYHLPLSNHFTVSGYIAGTFGPDLVEDGQKIVMNKNNISGKWSMGYDSDLWSASASLEDIGENFNPEIGFARRTNYRLSTASIEYTPRPQNRNIIRKFGYQVDGGYRTDHNNRLLDSEVEASFSIEFQNSARFSLEIKGENEYVDEDWEVREGYLIPMDTFSGTGYSFWFRSDASRRIAGSFYVEYGNYYTGYKTDIGLGSTITQIQPIKMQINFNHHIVNLPQGSFKTNTIGLRMFYFFSTELYLKGYVQWNDDKLYYEGREKLNSNLMLRWIYSPASNIFLVYNDGRLIGPGRDEISNRTVMLKATFFWRK